MGKVEISLTEDEEDAVKYVWEKVVKKRTRKKTLKALGWNSLEDFLSDIFRHGMAKASDDPIAFIKSRILGEFPILREGVEEEEVKKDLGKMYG